MNHRTRIARGGAAIMLAALAVRLASLLPGVPVLHWHGAIATTGIWGALPHEFGAAGCGGETGDLPGGGEGLPDVGYYSHAEMPAHAAALNDLLPPAWPIDRRVAPAAMAVREAGGQSPGRPRAPPGGPAVPEHGPSTPWM